jgi:DNA-binding CsgD family transcriptional regulator
VDEEEQPAGGRPPLPLPADASLAAVLRWIRVMCQDLGVAAGRRPSLLEDEKRSGEPELGRWTVCDAFQHAGHQFVVTLLHDSARRPSREASLSARERMVAEAVARGEALKVVAGRLSISLQAVSTYLGRARRKLGVTSRADLIRALQWEGGPSSMVAPQRRWAAPAGVARLSPQSPLADFHVHVQLRSGNQWLRVLRGPPAVSRALSSRLTPAEADILASVLQGMTTAQIARARATSARTVAAQVGTLMRKLGVTSRPELVARVLSASRPSGPPSPVTRGRPARRTL